MQANSQSAGKVHFANSLRGIAALFVVVCHLAMLFWLVQPVVKVYTGAPIYEGIVPSFALFLQKIQIFNFGAFGVSIFFLISGFVIPFALQQQTNMQFIIARIFRIWPTYLAGLSIGIISLYIGHLFFQTPFIPTLKSIISSAFLIFNFTGQPIVDSVAWTLAIEIKFYFLMLLVPFYLRSKPLYLAVLATSFLLYAFGMRLSFSTPVISAIFHTIKMDMIFLTYMFIGVSFNLLYQHKIKTKSFFWLVFYLMLIFLILGYKFPYFTKNDYHVPFAYVVGLALFSFFYISRNKIVFPSIFDKLADISYPMYVSHALFGWVFLRIFLFYSNSPFFALLSCFIFVFLISYLLHVLIEKPSYKMGKFLSKIYASIRNIKPFTVVEPLPVTKPTD